VKQLWKDTVMNLASSEISEVMDGMVSLGREIDLKFIQETNAILPPPHHGTTDGATQDIFAKIWEDADLNTMDQRICRAQEEIVHSWKINRTFFDPVWMEYNHGHLDQTEFNPVAELVTRLLAETMLGYMKEAPDFQVMLDKMTFFNCSSLFFWNVAHALTELVQRTSFAWN
jgi:hypothetical protein